MNIQIKEEERDATQRIIQRESIQTIQIGGERENR